MANMKMCGKGVLSLSLVGGHRANDKSLHHFEGHSETFLSLDCNYISSSLPAYADCLLQLPWGLVNPLIKETFFKWICSAFEYLIPFD